MPLQQRVPKRGFNNAVFRKEITAINVSALNRFDNGTEVTPELLVKSGVINAVKDGVKILGTGELEKALTVKVHGFSKSAVEKIQAAGGKAEVI